jgi:hypothetical protein
MRRVFAIVISALLMTPALLVLPVYAAPVPAPVPVTASTESVDLGSVAAPAPEAELQRGTSEPVDGQTPQEAAAPVLAVSEPVTAQFKAVGVTWAYDPAVTDTVVQVRVADAAGTWGDWTEIEPENSDTDAPAGDQAGLRGGTSPLWTGEGHGVEVEVLTRSGAAPTDVQAQLIDPGVSKADATPGGPAVRGQAHAATTMPAIYTRAQWGADEKIRTWDPEYAPTIKAATIHHTADTNDYTADQVPQIMRAMYQYHTVSRGWGDIGYNVLVDKFGRLWEGRYGGLSSTVIGAHAGGFNTGTFGVSMIGNYDLVEPSAAMLESVAQVIAWKFSLYGVDPRGTTRLTSGGGGTAKYAAGVTVTEPTVFAHRDVGSTVCPGRYGYAKMDSIRSRVTALMTTASSQRWWELRDSATSGPAPHQVWFGGPGAVTLACDALGAGRDQLAVYDNGTWYLRASLESGAADKTFTYGAAGWLPVCGDWNGDGRDGIGVYDPHTGTWYLRDTATPGRPDAGTVQYGWSGAAPVVGDWDGDGTDTIGVYERATGVWMVRDTNTPGAPDEQLQYGFAGAVPVPADYDGDGSTDVGVMAAGTWYLRNSFSPGAPDRLFSYGLRTDQPVVGRWDVDGSVGVGVSRAAQR